MRDPKNKAARIGWGLFICLWIPCSARAAPLLPVTGCVASQVQARLLSHYAFVDPASDPQALAGDGKFLGAGMGGQVRLVKNPDRSSSTAIVKKTSHAGRGGKQILDTEEAVFSALHQLASARRSIGFRLPKVARFQETDPTVPGRINEGLYVEYMRGRNAQSVLLDPRTPEATKSLIRARYEESLKTLEAAIQGSSPKMGNARIEPASKFHMPAEENDGLSVLTGTLAGKPLLIKSDNIIVDPFDLTLSIIDPF